MNPVLIQLTEPVRRPADGNKFCKTNPIQPSSLHYWIFSIRYWLFSPRTTRIILCILTPEFGVLNSKSCQIHPHFLSKRPHFLQQNDVFVPKTPQLFDTFLQISHPIPDSSNLFLPTTNNKLRTKLYAKQTQS